ncbi:MAG: hypothetical protein U1F35_15965 [Steroidobacteraceae bacterium]
MMLLICAAVASTTSLSDSPAEQQRWPPREIRLEYRAPPADERTGAPADHPPGCTPPA